MGRLGRVLLVTIAIAWLFVVTVNYYLVHKPFTADNVVALLSALGDVVVVCALFALAAAVGRRLLHGLAFGSELEALVLETGLGLGVIALATLALGLLGLVNRILFWSLLLGVLFLLRSEISCLRSGLRSLRLTAESSFERGLAVFCGLSLLIALLYALTPPASWDAQVSHLVIPKTVMQQGRITAPPDNVYFSVASLLEMLYLAVMLLKGDIAAQVVHWGLLVLLLGAVYSFGVRYFNSIIAWLASVILLAVPNLLLVSTWANSDLGVVFFGFAGVYALAIGRGTGRWEWFALAGAYGGLAAGAKYQGIAAAFALVVLLWRTRWTLGACHMAFTALSAAPWYLRNWAFTGNPLYPFLFGGLRWDSFREYWFSRFGTGLANAPLQLLAAPWEATIMGVEGKQGYEATIGPLLLMLVPLVLLTLSGQSRLRLHGLAIYSAVFYGFWLFGLANSRNYMQGRQLLAAFPGLALVGAVAFDRLRALDFAQFSLHRFARLVVLLVMLLTFSSYAIEIIADNPLRFLAGLESRDDYLSRRLGPYYAAIQYVNHNLPTTSRVLFLWETRSYYAQRWVQPDASLDLFPHWTWQLPDADSVVALWRSEGYTHVLMSRIGLDFMIQSEGGPVTVRDLGILQEIVKRDLRQVYGQIPFEVVSRDGKLRVVGADQEAYAVYELVAPAPVVDK